MTDEQEQNLGEALEEYDFRTRGPRGTKYPYHEWANGKPWRLRRGEQFTNDPKNFIIAVYQWARKNGFKVQSRREDENTIVLRMTPREADGENVTPLKKRKPTRRKK